MVQSTQAESLYRASKHKLLILCKAGVICVVSFLIGGLLLWKFYGLVDIVRHWFNWNRCYADGIFMSTVCLRVCAMLGLYNRYPSFKVFNIHLAMHMIINTLLPGYLVSLVLPNLCQRHFITGVQEGRQIEVTIQFTGKLLILSLSFAIYFITSIILNTPVQIMARNGKSKCRNVIDYLQAVVATVTMVWIWVSFVISTIALGSLQMDTLLEICVFGYSFPIVKSMVVQFTVMAAKRFDKINENPEEMIENGNNSLVTMFISCASIACGLAQLYVIYMSSSNYMLFSLQYIPHELIKKASWGTYLRCFRRFRLRYSRRIFNATSLASRQHVISAERNIILQEESTVAIPTPTTGARTTISLVNANDKAVAKEIVGREFGEDVCMFVAGAAVTPVVQECMFFHTGGSIARGPSYIDLAVCIVGIVFVLENLLTIAVLAGLIRDGIPISHESVPWISEPRIVAIQIIIVVGIMLAMDMALVT